MRKLHFLHLLTSLRMTHLKPGFLHTPFTCLHPLRFMMSIHRCLAFWESLGPQIWPGFFRNPRTFHTLRAGARHRGRMRSLPQPGGTAHIWLSGVRLMARLARLRVTLASVPTSQCLW